MNQLFNKINIKKQQREDPSQVEQSVINLGLVKAMHSKITANELAAKGIKLSIKTQLIEFIKKLESDKQTTEAKELLSMLIPAAENNAQQVQESDVVQIDTSVSAGIMAKPLMSR